MTRYYLLVIPSTVSLFHYSVIECLTYCSDPFVNPEKFDRPKCLHSDIPSVNPRKTAEECVRQESGILGCILLNKTTKDFKWQL